MTSSRRSRFALMGSGRGRRTIDYHRKCSSHTKESHWDLQTQKKRDEARSKIEAILTIPSRTAPFFLPITGIRLLLQGCFSVVLLLLPFAVDTLVVVLELLDRSTVVASASRPAMEAILASSFDFRAARWDRICLCEAVRRADTQASLSASV